MSANILMATVSRLHEHAQVHMQCPFVWLLTKKLCIAELYILWSVFCQCDTQRKACLLQKRTVTVVRVRTELYASKMLHTIHTSATVQRALSANNVKLVSSLRA